MTSSRRRWALVFAGLAMVALVFVAASLRQLEFSSGFLLPREQATEEILDGVGRVPTGRNILEYVTIVVYALSVALLPLAIYHLIKSPAFRRRILAALMAYLWFMAVVMVLSRSPELLTLFGIQAAPAPLAPALTEDLPLTELPPATSPWLAWAVALGLTAAVVAFLVGAVWLVWTRLPRPSGFLEELAKEAGQAVAALEGGANLNDTIIRCYVEMSRVLRVERNLARESAMTPREFEKRLGEAGLPESSVCRLTRLFEAVRYGAKQTGEQEKQQAISCLTAIVEACRSKP